LSNELVDHLLEIKNPKPLLHAAEIEQGLVDGVRAAARFLQERAGGRLLPGGMHPTLDPQEARPWRRSDQRLIRTYERYFGLQSHARANVQALQINLPMGSDQDAVCLMNAAALLVPYLPALAASSPLIERNLGTSVDNRLACLLAQPEPIPSRRGDFVPEYLDRYADYRNHILGPMFEAVDTLPEAEPIRQDFLNGRAAVFRLSRRAIEIRLCDTQECPKMDVAIAVFVRKAIRWLAQRLREGQFVRPDHTVLVRDLHAVICDGTQARVLAPHLLGERGRAVDGTISAAEALRPLLARVRARPSAESAYLDLIARILDSGNLSEAIRRQLRPLEADRTAFEVRLHTIYNELADCLVANQPWEGRFT
jgi:glutamate--cysteine ligase